MLYAKRAKRDPFRIVCGACSNGLAWISTSIIGRGEFTSEDVNSPTTQVPVYRHILIEEGWFPDSARVWRPSARARRQLRRGMPVQNRRRPKSHVERWNEQGGPLRHWEDEQHRSGFLLTVLPVEIVCLYCDMRQVLDAKTLDAEEFAMPGLDAAALRALNRFTNRNTRNCSYDGFVQISYRRVRIDAPRAWTVVSDLTRLYLHYQDRMREAAGRGGVLPLAQGPSAVAEFGQPNID